MTSKVASCFAHAKLGAMLVQAKVRSTLASAARSQDATLQMMAVRPCQSKVAHKARTQGTMQGCVILMQKVWATR